MKKVVIIGGGVGGLATACIMAKKGYDVELFEKNKKLGGRMNIFSAKGFTFDMGPSWYLMPDIFENFYNLMGEKVEDHLDLVKLSPSYRIFFKGDESLDMYSNLKKDIPTLEKLEKGAGDNLKKYLNRAEKQYNIAKESFIYKNYNSIFDFINFRTMIQGTQLSVFSKMENYVSSYFSNDKVKKIIQYPLVFLGSSPYTTPALYSIMNHIDFNMGVFYPMGGMYEIAKSLINIAQKHGAVLHTSTQVSSIIVRKSQVKGIKLAGGKIIEADIVISNGDIHHTEMNLLSSKYRQYHSDYWEKRVLAPSALIMYLGVKKQFPSLQHHNLLFSRDWGTNFAEIFDDPKWPTDPSLYVCAPSKTDPSVAPKGNENLFVLVPIASGLNYTDEFVDEYADKILTLMEDEMGLKGLKKNIIYKRLYSVKDFKEDYNSYKGTALGLAHTISQTAIFRPSNVSSKVKNLYYVGGNTNPGIGVPICLISAEMVYKRVENINSDGALKTL